MSKTRAVIVCMALALAAALLAALGGCARREAATSIRQIGSTTVLPLAQKWREAFNAQHPEVNIAVSGGGSGTGIEALIAGTAEIANASREIKAKEIERAKAAGVEPLEQLSDIYTGKINDWKKVGAQGMGEIQVISRDSASGTYESFKELVVTLHGKDQSRDYAPAALKQVSNQAVLTLVAQSKNAIGYVGLGYLDQSVKTLSIIPLGGGQPVAPSAENILKGSYAISRLSVHGVLLAGGADRVRADRGDLRESKGPAHR